LKKYLEVLRLRWRLIFAGPLDCNSGWRLVIRKVRTGRNFSGDAYPPFWAYVNVIRDATGVWSPHVLGAIDTMPLEHALKMASEQARERRA
jgi:hypothetical protein